MVHIIILIPLVKAMLAAGTLVVLAYAVLHWDHIVNYFQSKAELKMSDKNNIAFSLQERLSNGKYRTVYGIFNQNENRVCDGQVVESQEIDSRVAENHLGNPLVVYE